MAKVQVGREAAGSGKLRMIPVFGIVLQPVVDEISKHAQGVLSAALASSVSSKRSDRAPNLR